MVTPRHGSGRVFGAAGPPWRRRGRCDEGGSAASRIDRRRDGAVTGGRGVLDGGLPMADDVANPVLEHLHYIRGRVDYVSNGCCASLLKPPCLRLRIFGLIPQGVKRALKDEPV
ncbi:hypothetical protein GALL_329970 [mine drainage metagenome]|uniref:Uncharacterized protein n=1 Tax=mine drainage metagenome TaxID=410659 RepID=A0A1J5QNN0_9ZZZZ